MVLGVVTSGCFFSGLDEDDVVEDDNDGGGAWGVGVALGDGVATVGLDC